MCRVVETTRDGKLYTNLELDIELTFLGPYTYFQSFVVLCKSPSLNHPGLISFSAVQCPFSTPSGLCWWDLSNLEDSPFVSCSRSMTRAQRAPSKRTTPTSATFSPAEIVTPNPSPTIKTPLYLSSPFVEAALVKGNFKTIVMLPKYVNIMEWVAMNSMCSSPRTYTHPKANGPHITPAVFDFYTNLNEFYGVVAECCTQQSCPTMSAGHT